jgi:hypothetical protein
MAVGIDEMTAGAQSAPRPVAAEPEPTAGNSRLTASTAVLLILMLAVEGLTILFLRQLLPVHLFVGAMLIPPVAVKLGSTGYRFARYYSGSPIYTAKGPPPALLRAIGPVVVITTAAVLASGIALILAGPSERSTLLPIHKVSFIVWLAFTGLHVLGHVLELPDPVRDDLRRTAGVPGRGSRWMVLALALAAGTALGVWALSYAGPWAGTFHHFHH